MSIISYLRVGEYLKTCLTILEENNGSMPSKDLLREMAVRLKLNDHEKSLNNSGHFRWATRFRFHSIGLVKGGWIKKEKGLWILTEKARDYKSMTAIEIYNFNVNAYDEWNSNRLRDDVISSDDSVIAEEPEVLMDVEPGDISFQKLIASIDIGKIQIPPFQRSFVWSPSDIKELLDSIYRGYPVGSFIFWKTTRLLPRTRTIGNIAIASKDVTAGTEISYVLDGQQRITSLFAAVKGASIDSEYFRFLFDIRSKKFVVKRVEIDETENSREIDINNLQISIGLLFTESRAEYSNIVMTYPPEYQDVLHNLYDRFVSYRFSVIQVLDKEFPDNELQDEGIKQVVNMFSRINDTGHKLTVVAKMVARCWGDGFDLREALDELYKSNPNLSSIREETVLQAASVVLNYRKCSSRDILDRTNIQKLESEWDNIIRAFLLAVQFVSTKIKIKNLDYLPFDAVLVPLTYLFYKKHEPNHIESSELERWFWKACLSNRYSATVASKLEEDCLDFDKLLEGDIPNFAYLIDWDSLKSKLVAQQYNLRNAFVKTVLSLYSYAEPKNLTDGRDVSIDKVFSGYYKHNLHHIFPQAYLRKNEVNNRDLFDSIVNIMFIPAITNNRISGTDPADYFNQYLKSNSEINEILTHHYIPNVKSSGLLENNFLKFLDYRAQQIVSAFRVRTGIGSKSEEDFLKNPSKPIDILESRIRNFIHEKLSQHTEDSYWKDFIPMDIQEVVDKKIQSDLRRHPYGLEEYLRDEVRSTYLDIMDYEKIISSNWEVFGQYFGSRGEVSQHFRALKNYRNPIKHGRNLNEVDKRNGEAAVLWLESIIK